MDVSLFANYMRMDAGFPQRGFAPDGRLERVRGQFNYWSAGAMLTIPILNRNQGDAAVARAERTGAAAAYDAARLAAEAELASARARDERAREAVKIYGAGAQALARQNLTVVGQSYELGRVTVFEVLAERRRYLDVERAYTEALRAAYEARTALNRALGEGAMTSDTRMTMHRGAAALVAIALLAAGAGATYLLMRGDAGAGGHAADMPSPTGAQPSPAASAGTSNAPLPDVVVPLSQDAVERAGIVVAPVASGTSATEIRLPGVVEPNAYRQVVVTPLVAGRVTKVGPALGDRVRRGQTLAEIYSPALAEAQTRYVSAQAMLDAHDRELQRTQKLVEIGAASRQELEKIHAEHAAQTAAVQSARSQLELLGVSASALDNMASGRSVSATTNVPAPIDGVVTERGANVGLNVDPATKLFTVVDLSTVWVVADLYEKDFSRVRVGSEAAITTSARPDLTLRGRVSYIDPQVSADTRTAKVRIEVPNSGGELRLGMYADVVVTGAQARRRLESRATPCRTLVTVRSSIWRIRRSPGSLLNERSASVRPRENRSKSCQAFSQATSS